MENSENFKLANSAATSPNETETAVKVGNLGGGKSPDSQLVTNNKNRWHNIFTPAHIIIGLIIICATLSIYFRSVYREQPIMDERVYAYICNEEEGRDFWVDNKCLDKVESTGDAIYSQINHYKYINGRFVVHFLEQMFTRVWGIDAFNILNAIVFALLIVFVMLYTSTAETRNNPLHWVLAFAALILLFPFAWRLWTSNNYAPNYLFPSFLAVVYLHLFDKLKDNNFSSVGLILFCAMSVILGASHEAFSIPLSGAMVVYGLINIKTVFKTQRVYPIIFLWLGTIFLLLSPGNFTRLSGTQSGGPIYAITNDIDNMMHIKMMWLALFVMVAYTIFNRKTAKQFVKDNYILTWSFFWALILSFIANTGTASLTGVELISLLIAMKLLAKTKFSHYNKLNIAASAIILAVIAFVQIQVVHYGKIQMQNYEKCIEEYIANNDGIFRKPIIDKPFYVKPYTMDWTTGMANMCLTQNLQKDYKQWGKKPMPLIDKEYDALADGSMFTAKNAIPGGSGFYGVSSGSGYWAQHDSINPAKQQYEFSYKPVHFSSPGAGFCLGIRFALSPESYPKQARIDSVKTVNTRWGSYYFIEKPLLFEVTAITAK